MAVHRIQLAIRNGAYAAALRDSLVRNGAGEVVCVDAPDPRRTEILVVDSGHLAGLAGPLEYPGRIVVIANNDPGCLARAWELGVTSVVYERDPLNTAVLAVMSAGLASGRNAGSAAGAKAPGVP